MKLRQLVIFALLVCVTGIARAGDIIPFTQQVFAKLNQEGKPVIVDVAADWCTTCRAQKPIIENLANQPDYRDVSVLTVDFDKQKEVLPQFKVYMQSTIIAFNKGKEAGRSVGDTRPAGIESLFKKTVE